ERGRPNIRFNFQHLSGLGPERHPRRIVVAKFHSTAPRTGRTTRYCPAASRGRRHYHFWVVYRERRQPISVAASERHDFGCARVRLKTIAIPGCGLRSFTTAKSGPRTDNEIERVYWP